MNLAETNRSHTFDSEDTGVSYGNPPTFFGWGLVGFVDLLGFSASVLSSWSDAPTSPLARLLRIKQEAADLQEEGLIPHIPGATQQPGRVFRCRVQTFSDSIIVCSAQPERRMHLDLVMGILSVARSMQSAWIAAIREGYTVRGAVELGPVFWSDTETVGPALVDAYHLEKLATTSRVIAGPRLLQNLLQVMPEDWSEWPPSEWLATGDDGLVELSPLELKDKRSAILKDLEALQEQAGSNAYRYHRVIAVLRGEQAVRKASRADIERGRIATLRRLRLGPYVRPDRR